MFRALKHNDRSEYQGKDVNAVVMDIMNRVLSDRGIGLVESNPELATNADVQGQWKYYEKRQHKRRRCNTEHLM